MMKKVKRLVIPVFAFVLGVALTSGYFLAKTLVPVPPSPYASKASADAQQKRMDDLMPHMVNLATGDINERRNIIDKHFYLPRIEEARQFYRVSESVQEIGGVYTEVFEPAGGIPEQNKNRVLINLHGGGFSMAARTEGRLESIPVAHEAKMKVISVDYRQGPEHRFPAASEDVATVYKHLLQQYNPAQIGIFGCSAGGVLAAQSVAWFDANDLPIPGAIGISCAGAGLAGGGDSVPMTKAMGIMELIGDIEYFKGVNLNDPLVQPLNYPDLLSRFPPSIIITSTRDQLLSPAVVTHQRLNEAGVYSQLHVFEGLNHYFFADTGLPESREVFRLTAEFFDTWLER